MHLHTTSTIEHNLLHKTKYSQHKTLLYKSLFRDLPTCIVGQYQSICAPDTGWTDDGRGPRLCRVFNFVQMTACRRVIASTHFYLLLVSSDVIIKRLIVSSHHNEIFLIQSLLKISFKILIEHQNERVNLRHF